MTASWQKPPMGQLLWALFCASTVAVLVPLGAAAMALSKGFTDPGALLLLLFAPFGIPVAALFAAPLILALRIGLLRNPPLDLLAMGGLGAAILYLLVGGMARADLQGSLLELLAFPAAMAREALPGPPGIPRDPVDGWLSVAMLAGIPAGGFLAGLVLGQIMGARRS